MSYHDLNNEIHAEDTGDASYLSALSQKIVDSGLGSSVTGSFGWHMAIDHVWREYNKLAFELGLTGSMVAPYDAGLRPSGLSILPGGAPAETGNLIRIDGDNLVTIAGDNLITIT